MAQMNKKKIPVRIIDEDKEELILEDEDDEESDNYYWGAKEERSEKYCNNDWGEELNW